MSVFIACTALSVDTMATEIANSQLQPRLNHDTEISWNYKENTTKICCWDLTIHFASHIGFVHNEISYEKDNVDILLL